jgi:ketosteroid isomerase-like protein
MTRRLLTAFFAAAIFASPALAGGCKSAGGRADIDAVKAQRTVFNQAIAAKDLSAMATVLAENVLLVTGTNSDRFDGRDTQLHLWGDDFASPDRAVYVRTPQCVRVSAMAPVALEYGRWRGERERGAENFAAGSYSAKWRLADGVWRLEAELFATEDCGGDFCPAAAAD